MTGPDKLLRKHRLSKGLMREMSASCGHKGNPEKVKGFEDH